MVVVTRISSAEEVGATSSVVVSGSLDSLVEVTEVSSGKKVVNTASSVAVSSPVSVAVEALSAAEPNTDMVAGDGKIRMEEDSVSTVSVSSDSNVVLGLTVSTDVSSKLRDVSGSVLDDVAVGVDETVSSKL